VFRLRAPAWLVGFVVGVSSVLAASEAKLERFEFIEPHMGTLFQIVLFAPELPAAKSAAQAAFTRIEALNHIMSDYDDTSELNQLCRQPTGAAVPISAELFDILQRSQALSEKSSGAFDATLGPAIRLWRESRKKRKLPSEEKRLAALQACGFAKLRLDATRRTATLLVPDMRLDLGGIAKGYAADAALAELRKHGFSRAMVAASGDLALGDAPPNAHGWNVTLAPFGDASAQTLTIVVANAGVSTSGAAEQFVEIGGSRYSHIIDPVTALGLTSLTAVTVIAPHATLSDALATACCIMPPVITKNVAGHWDESVRVIVYHRNAEGSLQFDSYGTPPAGLLSSP
jgi:thiamine biosynthesis lipoprotein